MKITPRIGADAAEIHATYTTKVAALPRLARTRQGKIKLLDLSDLDQRTTAAKTARSLVGALIADLGGQASLSIAERELVTRVAMLGAILADFETRWVTGEQVSFCDYLAAINAQRRVLATLGLQRRPRDVSLDPLAYARQHDDPPHCENAS